MAKNLNEQSLAYRYIEYLDLTEKGSEKTVNDFFNFVGLPSYQRSNFVYACILRQAQEICDIRHQECYLGAGI